MDENNNWRDKENCIFHKYPILKYALIALSTFLGAFAAFYIVTDWHYKKMFPIYQINKFDKLMQNEEKQMFNMAEREFKNERFLQKENAQIVHFEKNEDEYKIIIDLKLFDNNENNINVTTNENTLTIEAKGEINKHHKDTIIRFTQSFIMPNDANLSKLDKYKENNKYIISIPIDKD